MLVKGAIALGTKLLAEYIALFSTRHGYKWAMCKQCETTIYSGWRNGDLD